MAEEIPAEFKIKTYQNSNHLPGVTKMSFIRVWSSKK